jgi:hypothetical protein
MLLDTPAVSALRVTLDGTGAARGGRGAEEREFTLE